MAGAKSAAGILRSAVAVAEALRRLPPSRALTLVEIKERTGIEVTRLRRLLPSMVAAGLPVVAEPDPRSAAPVACRPLVYSLAAPDPLRDLREGEGARVDGAS